MVRSYCQSAAVAGIVGALSLFALTAPVQPAQAVEGQPLCTSVHAVGLAAAGIRALAAGAAAHPDWAAAIAACAARGVPASRAAEMAAAIAGAADDAAAGWLRPAYAVYIEVARQFPDRAGEIAVAVIRRLPQAELVIVAGSREIVRTAFAAELAKPTAAAGPGEGGGRSAATMAGRTSGLGPDAVAQTALENETTSPTDQMGRAKFQL